MYKYTVVSIISLIIDLPSGEISFFPLRGAGGSESKDHQEQKSEVVGVHDVSVHRIESNLIPSTEFTYSSSIIVLFLGLKARLLRTHS